MSETQWKKDIVTAISDILQKAPTQSYDTLVKLRSTYLKFHSAIPYFCCHGGIKALLEVIKRHPVISCQKDGAAGGGTDAQSKVDHCIIGIVENSAEENVDTSKSLHSKCVDRISDCTKNNNLGFSEGKKSGVFSKINTSDSELDLEKINIKILDVAFSILANCCIHTCGRNEVIKHKGIGGIVSVLKFCTVDSISSRVCRSLANIAQTPDNVIKILKYDVLVIIVKRLKDTSDKDSQQTFIRTLRLLGDTSEHRELIIEAEGVRPIAEFLKSDDETIVNTSIRALDDLTRGCSVGCARQLLEADCLQCLVDLVSHDNESSVKHAIQTICHVCAQESIRPTLGNNGAITCFINNIKNNSVEKSMLFLNCLCLCCQEVVNRMKIREQFGLEMMLSKLNDVAYSSIHYRIVSALLHFHSNDVGMKKLLDNNLVGTLIVQLQICAGISDFKFDTFLSSLYDKYFADISQENILLEDCSEDLNSIFDNSLSDISVAEDSVTQHCGDVDACSSKPCETTTELVRERDFKDMDVTLSGKPLNDIKYSMDSPTYEQNNWSLEEYCRGQKCIERFSTNPLHSTSASSSPSYDAMPEPFSPLSTQSLMSSSRHCESSPAYSSFSDWSNGPVDQTYDSFALYESQPFSPVAQLEEHLFEDITVETNSDLFPEECGSKAPFQSNSGARVTDNSNTDDIKIKRNKCVLKKNMENVVTETIKTKTTMCTLDFKPPPKQRTTDPIPDVCNAYCYRELDDQMTEQLQTMVRFSQDCEKQTPPSGTGPYSAGKFMRRSLSDAKRRHISGSSNSSEIIRAKPIKRRRHEDPKGSTERNILYILSRVSHMEECEKYLVSKKTLDILLRFVMYDIADSHSRSWKVLNTLTKHIYCFESLIKIDLPLKIFHMFCKPCVRIAIDTLNSTLCQNSSHERVKTSNDDHLKSQTSSINKCLIDNTELHFTSKNPDYWRTIDTLNEKGHGLLENLTMNAESSFGRGVIYQGLLDMNKDIQIRFAMNAAFLCRSSFLMRKVFLDGKALNLLLDELKIATCAEDKIFAITHLFQQLGNIASSKDLKTSSNIFTGNTTPKQLQLHGTCYYIVSSHDYNVTFICKDEEKVSANRSLLVSRSDVLSSMLSGHYSESSQSEIKLTAFSCDAFTFLVHFLYNCSKTSCTVLHGNYTWTFYLDLLEIADHFLLPRLKDWIVAKLSKKLSFISLVPVMQYAEVYSCPVLVEYCVHYLFTCKMNYKNMSKILLQLIDLDSVIKIDILAHLSNYIEIILKE